VLAVPLFVEFVESLLILNVALRVPVTVGVNVTVITQLSPPFR
jgi:hypothetical protein